VPEKWRSHLGHVNRFT